VLRELIRERQLREQEASYGTEAIRAKLIKAEESGFTDQSTAEIRTNIKNGFGRDTLQNQQ